jgi:hypothetical protein
LRDRINESSFNSGLNYWKEKLKGVEQLNLPLDYQRPAENSQKGAVLSFEISRSLSDQLSIINQSEGVQCL